MARLDRSRQFVLPTMVTLLLVPSLAAIADAQGLDDDADELTGRATLQLDTLPNCAGEWVSWEDWSSYWDATCVPEVHAFRSIHGARGGALAEAHPAVPPTRTVLGSLWRDGSPRLACVPAASSTQESCTVGEFLFSSERRCWNVRGVNHLNTGEVQTISRRGPWTTC
jgi:hypothetical protein